MIDLDGIIKEGWGKEFIPAWKHSKFKDRIDGWKHVFSEMVKNKKKVTSKGLTNEAEFQLGNQMFIIKGAKRK